MRDGILAALFEEVRAEQETVQAFDEAAAARLGINLTDLRCLGILERKGPITATQLGDETGLTSGSVTALVDRLEKAGYVSRVRDEGDRRRVFVELTDAATEAIDAIWGPLGRDGTALAERYSAEEIAFIVDYLRASRALLEQHLKRVRAAPADGQ